MPASILIVDDEPDIRETLRDLLDEEGYQVATAKHGRDALDVLERSEKPAIMIVDLVMPVMDGIELIETLRSDPRYAGIPIIIVSASSTIRPPQGTVLLRKPVSVDRLLEEIEKHTPRLAAP